MSSPRFFARSLRRWLAASKARAEQLMEATQVRARRGVTGRSEAQWLEQQPALGPLATLSSSGLRNRFWT